MLQRTHNFRFNRPLTLAFCFASLIFTLACFTTYQVTATQSASSDEASSDSGGALNITNAKGGIRAACPLKTTQVEADITGFVSRVRVTQVFANPLNEKIEAVYVFPLPVMAAVDDMEIKIRERTVKGKILRREEARTLYEAAREQGQVAGLLDQERPNIFTQAVANIPAGEEVRITISYVETLKYEDGTYEFSFPTVVGPRYNPRPTNPNNSSMTGVPDRKRITPPVMRRGTRAGHDISLDINLEAGMAIEAVESKSHRIEVARTSDSSARVSLKKEREIPNRDFVLRYRVAGQKLNDALLVHRRDANKAGFLTFILQPPARPSAEDITPKEIVFVLDTSGSMTGFPIEKAKEAMRLALANTNPRDTFNLITFAGDTRVLFSQPVAPTSDNIQRAQEFLNAQTGGGGTEMMRAIRAALEPSTAQRNGSNAVRIVCFMTDGYVGNDMEIISEIQKNKQARIFSFGIGNAVNRYLLDKMAEEGRGEVEYVSLTDDGSLAARRFHERVQSPLLTDIELEWRGIEVTDVYPRRTPDVFSAKPIILTGRYTRAARGSLIVIGKTASGDYRREIAVELPSSEPRHDSLASIWARRKVDDLMNRDLAGIQRGQAQQSVKDEIVQLGLDYRLLTQFTSFVAVEEMVVTEPGTPPRRIDVPVELPRGVSNAALTNEAVGISGAPVSQGLMMSSNMSVSALPINGRVVRNGSRQRTPSTNTPGVAVKERSVKREDADEEISIVSDAAVNLSPAERKRRASLAKLQPQLAALIEKAKNRQALSGDEMRLVTNGKLELQVFLNDKSDEVLTKLKALGFEVTLNPQTSKLVIGRFAVDKIMLLAEQDFVRYIAVQK